MAVDASKVLVGALDQATTGAVLDAPVGTPIPTDLNSALNAAFKDSGYISSDGITLPRTLPKQTALMSVSFWRSSMVRSSLLSLRCPSVQRLARLVRMQ